MDTLQILEKYSTDTNLHNQQVGQIMKYFAKKIWQEEDYRYTVGILHDIDRDYIGKIADKHLKQDLDKIIDQLDTNYDKTQIKIDIKSHWPYLSGIEPTTLLQKYLISIDELSWLMYAYARMRWWFANMETKWVIKRIKEKSFAAWVDREHVRNCETYLSIPLEEFIWDMILAYQSFQK